MDELIIPGIESFSLLADADAQRVRTAVLANLAADSARYLSEYSVRFENVLNADDAATLFEEYNADRARYRVAVHPAAGVTSRAWDVPICSQRDNMLP